MTTRTRPSDLVTTDPTASALVSAIRANPRESAPASALTDRLIELGVTPATAHKYVHSLVLDLLPITDWPAADLSKLLRGTSLDAIRTSLDAANGRRRTRTVSLSQALHACRRARINKGAAWVGGGTVANKYGYPSQQTGFLAALAGNGKLRIVAGVCSANKGSSVTNQLIGLTKAATVEQFRDWADAGFPTALTAPTTTPASVSV